MLLKKRTLFTTKLTARTLNSSFLWLQLLITIVYTNQQARFVNKLVIVDYF